MNSATVISKGSGWNLWTMGSTTWVSYGEPGDRSTSGSAARRRSSTKSFSSWVGMSQLQIGDGPNPGLRDELYSSDQRRELRVEACVQEIGREQALIVRKLHLLTLQGLHLGVRPSHRDGEVGDDGLALAQVEVPPEVLQSAAPDVLGEGIRAGGSEEELQEGLHEVLQPRDLLGVLAEAEADATLDGSREVRAENRQAADDRVGLGVRHLGQDQGLVEDDKGRGIGLVDQHLDGVPEVHSCDLQRPGHHVRYFPSTGDGQGVTELDVLEVHLF